MHVRAVRPFQELEKAGGVDLISPKNDLEKKNKTATYRMDG